VPMSPVVANVPAVCADAGPVEVRRNAKRTKRMINVSCNDMQVFSLVGLISRTLILGFRP
jgi:hypothetical protein